MYIVALFAIICSAFALECPSNLSAIDGVCGVKRVIGSSDCPSGTKFDVGKNLCVLK